MVFYMPFGCLLKGGVLGRDIPRLQDPLWRTFVPLGMD